MLVGMLSITPTGKKLYEQKVYEQCQLIAFVWIISTVWNILWKVSVPTTPRLEAAGMSVRDSATSSMRGWEHWKPDGFASRLFLDQLNLLESWI
jgi:hypothetical protein